MEQIVFGGVVLGKREQAQEDLTIKYWLKLLCLGFQQSVEVSKKVYDEMKQGEVVQAGFVPMMVAKNNDGKMIKGFTPQFIGMKKAKVSDITNIPKLKVSVLTKESNVIPASDEEKAQGKEDFTWLNAHLTGALSGQQTIKKDHFEELQPMTNYEVSVIPVRKGNVTVLDILDWVPVGSVENEFSK